MQRLGEAAWAIRRAVDDIDGRSTVLTYDDTPHRVVAVASERPDDRVFVPACENGTQPNSALAEAYRVLADSQATNRIMVVFTDGSWQGKVSEAEGIIAAMREAGIITVLAYLDRFGRDRVVNAHGCEFSGKIDQPEGLARLFRTVATERITSLWS